MFRAVLTALLFFAAPLRADVPKVVTDIAPVHSLVAMVMGDLGEPSVLLRPGASPHSYAMRPSDAAALENADLVVWIGHGLTPWLEGPIERLSEDAAIIGLLEIAPVQHAIENEEDHDEHAGEDDHDEHEGHDDHTDHKDHDAHEGHDEHGDTDPHAWLDPVNAAHWVIVIGDALASRDDQNADTYRQNAKMAAIEILAVQAETAAAFGASGKKKYAVFHDAFGYFEARFGLDHSFAISDSHAVNPGPARIAELRESMQNTAVNCILTDGIEATGLLETVIEGHQTRIVIADPLGGGFTLGPLLYLDLTRNLADALSDC